MLLHRIHYFREGYWNNNTIISEQMIATYLLFTHYHVFQAELNLRIKFNSPFMLYQRFLIIIYSFWNLRNETSGENFARNLSRLFHTYIDDSLCELLHGLLTSSKTSYRKCHTNIGSRGFGSGYAGHSVYMESNHLKRKHSIQQTLKYSIFMCPNKCLNRLKVEYFQINKSPIWLSRSTLKRIL